MRRSVALYFSLLVTLSTNLKAQAIANQSEGVFQKLSESVEQSVAVARVGDGKMLFQINADKLLSPASVTKVVTTAAVLARFSPTHHFSTRFYFDGRRSGEVLHGNLIIVGDGDPFIINEKLWQLAADFRHLGIREFTGDIIIDNSLFSANGRDNTRSEGQKQSSHAYDAPVSAFGVNFNTFAVAVGPGAKAGGPATVELDPYRLQGISIENGLLTIGTAHQSAVQVSRVSLPNDLPKLVVRGGVPLGASLKKIYRSVDDHVVASGEYVRAFLLREGIRVGGKIRGGRVPKGAQLIYELPSYDLGFIVNGLNTFSNNYIADVLVHRLGAEFAPRDSATGTMAGGVKVLEDFLKNDVQVKGSFVLKNGSGLDTNNRLSAGQLVAILTFMESRFDLFPEFLASFPAAGLEGTMEKRLKGGAVDVGRGMVRAKTGTLSEPVSVASLAGYFRHAKHGLIAFAIIENGVRAKQQPGIGDLRARQDQALRQLMSIL